jgi:hypothetical protein
MLSAVTVFHVSGLLGFRWPLLSHLAMRDFIADPCRFPSALGYKRSKTTEVCTGVRPYTTTQGGALWKVCMVQRNWRKAISNPAHRHFMQNRLWGEGGKWMLVAGVKIQFNKTMCGKLNLKSEIKK